MDIMEIRKSAEYANAFANYIKTNNDSECRALLSTNVSGGVVPVPTMVYDIVKTAWEREGIMPRAVDREITTAMHMTHMGNTADPEAHLLKEHGALGIELHRERRDEHQRREHNKPHEREKSADDALENEVDFLRNGIFKCIG